MPSSAIRRYAYDPAQRRLDILFVSGQAYSYFGVPEAVFRDLGRARSKGRYFQERIRDKFDFRRDRTGLYRASRGPDK
ncbi:MAG: hypothetical protein BGP16_13050 [Sphingobium sp. 66-54]|nr:MAG: hypothetical protein BGP16_13050 [Sphingobium sp. 66-54]